LRPFLYELAEKLHQEYSKPESVTLVFPNRRASLYFRKYLSSLIKKPVFSPQLITIEEFITGFSPLQVPDKLELIHRLYKVYQQITHTEEEFDQFYFWGDMLIRDFDEVDKYMVNADLLFADLSHQKELDSRFDFLTPEQVEFLRSFWSGFDEKSGLSKENFLKVWNQLPEVHREFKKQLLSDGLAYEGMVHRDVAEKLEDGSLKLPQEEYWFVGFNALTKAEEKIIAHTVLDGKGQAHWDLDSYYLHNKTQEAGEFFRQYQNHSVLGKTFPPDVPSNFKSKKSFKIFGAAQPVGQAKAMAQLLQEELAKGINPEETLIVLPDEKLMLPVLHGISADVEKLNVTMGFPLTNTPMFNLIELLIELQSNRKGDTYNHRQVLALLGHPYVLAADPASANEKRKVIQKDNWVMVLGSMLRTDHLVHKEIFCEVSDNGILDYIRLIVQQVASLDTVDSLDKEYGLYFLKFLNRMEEVLGKRYTSLKAFLRLFRQLVKVQKIPFTGEPLRGLQVMGVLETRNLDFKNVFILSLNEGALPSGGGKGSYIPYNIRKAYQLPTVEHQDSIYAYLFYRVLQRAENVFLFYNTETDVLGQGEMSRYLQQLLYESGLDIERNVLHNSIRPQMITPIVVSKNEAILQTLANLNEGNYRFKGISPSALNSYIECKLKFYFQYIARIREPNEVEEDIDARVMGNFLHKVMELFYKKNLEKKSGKEITQSDFESIDKVVEELIEVAFIAEYNLEPGKKVEYEGQRLVVKEVVKRFTKQILDKDKLYAPFTIEGIELGGLTHHVKINQSPGYVVLGGNIDRVDRKDNLIRIIDYKTGKDKLDFDSLESLFIPSEKRNKAAFQTLVYALLYRTNISYSNATKLVPGLLNRINLFDESGSFGLRMNKEWVTDALPLLPEFESHLKKLLEEIFNPEEKFDQTVITETCRLCAYKEICHR